jgi:hypothetical protein
MQVNAQQQLGFVAPFETSRPSNPVFCHQEFLEKVAAERNTAIGRRATFLMQRLSVDFRRLHYKPTQGANRGWRRSRLGGNQGSHFYAWWAPKNAAPLKDADGFADAPEGALFLRDIRHHDDHSPLSPQSLADHYLAVTVEELRREEYGPAPWTPPQSKFAMARQRIRVLKGHPGSGKTTALWHAADSGGAERILYVTYSHHLATLARDYFDRFCSSHKRFEVVVFPQLLRQLLGSAAPIELQRELRRRFYQDLAPMARRLGAWANNLDRLYDEFYAHLVGEALPVPAGRFAVAKQPRVPDKAYRERRAPLLGTNAVNVVLESAARLEGTVGPLADRYFPDLSLAWRTAAALGARTGKPASPDSTDPAWLDFDCIAIDEVQDLTPIEALVLIELASAAARRRVLPVSLLWAGDEAQTVRPTDFEWGWLNDLLHYRIGTPSEHKLAANLRSPRQIAELVARVWDLYSVIEKPERPRGTGQAEIDDDSTDQVFYCAAAPGPELDELLKILAAREGLALITLEDTAPSFVPESVRPAVLTVSEAKGLDFHTVCVIDAGKHLVSILREEARLRRDASLVGLSKRLAIDQLRVALSRPSERLFWLDINPPENALRTSLAFLNGDNLQHVVSCSVPASILKTIAEEELDTEERVQRCQADARQYLEAKPEMAWSRAQQAVTLLGRPGVLSAVTDQNLRDTVYLTLAEICFWLGSRHTRLAPELGRPDFFAEAEQAATNARRAGLAAVIRAIGRLDRAALPADRLNALAELAQALPAHRAELESWALIEIAANARQWIEALEAGMLVDGLSAETLLPLLPGFYEAMSIPDGAERIERLENHTVQLLLKEKNFASALEVLGRLRQRDPKLEAICHEALGNLRTAAECFRLAGDLKAAVKCYRAVPDFESALALVREMKDHPAGPALEWMARLQTLVAARPDKFTRTVTEPEKKLLEDLLEQALGVKRRKPAASKPARSATRAPGKPTAA